MQKSLNIITNDSKKTSNFSKNAESMCWQDFRTHPDFWKEEHITNTLKGCNTVYSTACTASEWVIMEAAFIDVLHRRQQDEDACDFALIGVAWEHDESNIRHLSFGNWEHIEQNENDSWENIYSRTDSDDADELGSMLKSSIDRVLRDHGLIEKLSTLLAGEQTNASLLHQNGESLLWKLISGAPQDWDNLATNEPCNYDEMLSKHGDEHYLTLYYPSVDGRVRTRNLAECWITEPVLMAQSRGMTDSREITWNH
tara:strand:+ start:130 stop:894 length:765 start_codon:yes stop_codon:yes gene_type:complete